MNKKTLQKALDELNKESPRIDYVRGILEVLIGDDEVITPVPTVTFTPATLPNPIPVNNGGIPNEGMDILSGKTIRNG